MEGEAEEVGTGAKGLVGSKRNEESREEVKSNGLIDSGTICKDCKSCSPLKKGLTRRRY